MASYLTELEEIRELVKFYELLENAFPATSIQVGFTESSESYLNELRNIHFSGKDWRQTDFPDNENDSIGAAFDLLDEDSQLYYIAAYMRESIIDSFYQRGCLSHLNSLANAPNAPLRKLNPLQRESIAWYCDLVESQINELPFLSRMEFVVDTLAAKHIRNVIRNTIW